jgi:hypothetical protein
MDVIFNGEKAYPSKYEGYYCTRSGKILSIKVKGSHSKLDYNKPRELAYKKDKDGYDIVTISLKNDENFKKNIYVRRHKFVYETIFGEIPDGLTVDHIDNDKDHNYVENLQLLTREANAAKRVNMDWSLERRTRYKIYDNEMNVLFEGVDKFFLLEKYDIKNHDIHRYINNGLINNKMKKTRNNSKKDVEDIERISCNIILIYCMKITE